MSSCLRKGSIPYAVDCPHTGCLYLQNNYTPKCCALGRPNRKLTCKYFLCEKCQKPFKTCQELKKHQANNHSTFPKCCRY